MRHSARTIQLLLASLSLVSLGATAGCTQHRNAEVQAQQALIARETAPTDANGDVQALVRLGPRVTGTPVMEEASAYLIDQYRKAGYATEVQTFTYPKFEDLGSSLTVGGTSIKGQALNGSPAGRLTAPLVVIPNLGRPSDFAAVQVKGAIALVRRGEIRFLEKAQNAAAAGAVGLIIVNNEPDNFSGSLGGTVKIPVLGLSGKQGNSLLAAEQKSQANLAVNTRRRTVTGRNIVAHLPEVTRPRVLLGGHYDSVAGSPGANDNASGTAVVLAIARTAANTPLARQAWFVAFDGEEDGLHGSRAFVNQAEPQFLPGLKAMLNFDMVGVNPQLRVGGSKSLTGLVQLAQPGIPTFASQGGSDHAPFASAGVPVLFFYRGQEPNYHSPRDTQIDPTLLNQTAQVGFSVIQALLKAD